MTLTAHSLLAFRPRRSSVLVALACAVACTVAAAAPIERELEIEVSLEGKQDWRNELQWSKATTTQRYVLRTRLRSDGRLEGANLLDLDTDRRLAIKTEYLRRQGLARLEALGLDPNSPNIQADISKRMRTEDMACKGELVCRSEVSSKYASIMAAAMEADNSALFDGEPRYLFFSGYQGCPSQVQSMHRTSVKGETAYGRKKDKIHPYALDMNGDQAGIAAELETLCSYYTVVLDTLESRLYVENTFLPPAHGSVVRTEFGKSQTTQAELPIPGAALDWVTATLRSAPPSGSAQARLPLTLPLDGNSTVMGNFTGELDVQLKWAFK